MNIQDEIAKAQEALDETKRRAAAAIAERETQLAELKKRAFEEELPPVFRPSPDDDFYTIFQAPITGRIFALARGGRSRDAVRGFRTRYTANAYADAFNVLLELRTCEGVVPARNGVWQWQICVNAFSDGLTNEESDSLWKKLENCFSPCFDTEEHEIAAREKVGDARILRAMKTLAWAKE